MKAPNVVHGYYLAGCLECFCRRRNSLLFLIIFRFDLLKFRLHPIARPKPCPQKNYAKSHQYTEQIKKVQLLKLIRFSEDILHAEQNKLVTDKYLILAKARSKKWQMQKALKRRHKKKYIRSL